jgi:F420-non-reducing hydrogenase iron-sulfur subunit
VSEFAPKVVVFSCNWCFCTGTDPAELLGVKPNSNVRLVKTMCSGRIEPTFVLQAFANGADGVYVAACHPGDCHYNSGNFKTVRRMTLLKAMMKQMGIEPERLKVEYVSTEEPNKFKTSVSDFTKDVAKLGPLSYDAVVKKVATAVP